MATWKHHGRFHNNGEQEFPTEYCRGQEKDDKDGRRKKNGSWFQTRGPWETVSTELQVQENMDMLLLSLLLGSVVRTGANSDV